MHLTLKKEATKPAAANFLQQQARFDKFIAIFNHERPHEALDMKCPAEVYQPSPYPISMRIDMESSSREDDYVGVLSVDTRCCQHNDFLARP